MLLLLPLLLEPHPLQRMLIRPYHFLLLLAPFRSFLASLPSPVPPGHVPSQPRSFRFVSGDIGTVIVLNCSPIITHQLLQLPCCGGRLASSEFIERGAVSGKLEKTVAAAAAAAARKDGLAGIGRRTT